MFRQEYKYIKEYLGYIPQEMELQENSFENENYTKCLWCGEKIVNRYWCDSYCRDLWEMYNSK